MKIWDTSFLYILFCAYVGECEGLFTDSKSVVVMWYNSHDPSLMFEKFYLPDHFCFRETADLVDS